ncbi:MAG: tyrosine-type recombinase/integrase [Chloroflexota bacterium]
MTANAIVPQQQTIADLLAEVTSKDARHRVNAFVAWMHSTGGNWQTPDLAAYRDYLLTVTGLAPASVAAHLSTVRGRYQRLLDSNALRTSLYSLTPDEASAADRKAFVDETLAQLANAVRASAAPITVIHQQDDLDAQHVRLSIEQALELLDAPATDARNTRREALRDAALIALMLCTGLREMEVCALDVDDLRQKVNQQLGVAVVRSGKGAKARFVPYGGLAWCLEYADTWLTSAGISSGAVFRGFRKAKRGSEKPVRPARLSVRAVQEILKRYPVYGDNETLHVAPHDLRRTYARFLHDAGVLVVAIQQNLGHATLETTLRYIGDLKIEQRKPPTILRPNMCWLKET